MTRRWTGLALLVLLLAGLWLRLPRLGTYLTPDERLWSQRTVQFVRALQAGDWAATVTTGHPGVTVMWAGAGGVLLRSLADRAGDAPSVIGLVDELAAEPNRRDMIAWLRLPVVLATTLALFAIFLLARRLLGPAVGLLGAAFLLFDPFFLAHSRVLQMDALLASAISIAWLALLAATATQQRRYLVLSGVAAGLGVLTKSPALALGPPMLVWLVWSRWRQSPCEAGRSSRGRLAALLVDVLCVGLPALATVFLLWPAMWTDPLAPVLRVWRFATAIGGTEHELRGYWLGQVVDSPGALFYPAVLVWRTTPVTLIGLVGALGLLIGAAIQRRRARQEPPAHTGLAALPGQRHVWALLGFALWFGCFMAMGDKEADRYLLPIFPLLDLTAAWGWLSLLAWVGVRAKLPQRWRQSASAAFMALLVLVHAVAVAANRPSFLTAYNPLAGGMPAAAQVMSVGWGEGLEEAAVWLNETGGQHRTAAAWYGHNVFGPFFDGRTYDLYYDARTATDLYTRDVDYAVIYLNQMQRDLLDPSVAALLAAPIKTVEQDGVALAQVYAWPKPFQHTADQDVAPGLRLLGWTVSEPDAAGRLPVTLYWDADRLAGAADLPPIVAWIKDGAGEVWAQDQSNADPAAGTAPAWLDRRAISQSLALQLPTGLPAGPYRIEMAPLAGAGIELGTVDLPPSPYPSIQTPVPASQVRFGDSVQLVDAEFDWVSDQAALDLLWTGQGPVPPNAMVFVHLVDASDQIVAQTDGPLATVASGQVVRQRFHLQPQAGAGPSDLRLVIGLYLPDTGARLPLTIDGVTVPDGRYPVLANLSEQE